MLVFPKESNLLEFGIIKSIPKDYCCTCLGPVLLLFFKDPPIIITLNSNVMTKANFALFTMPKKTGPTFRSY